MSERKTPRAPRPRKRSEGPVSAALPASAKQASTCAPGGSDERNDADIAHRLLAWFDRHGRHDLPWQHPRTPYRVWLSEIMLQQTQVSVVVGYFGRFVDALPDLPALARAPQDTVLALWSGLGYYARARNLHAAAKRCVEQHGGDLPRDLDALVALPGIGRSTAGAILSQAWNEPAPILDGNVKRVLCRVFGIDGWPGLPAVEKRLWAIAERLLPQTRLADWTQAQMDFGATLCTRANPACAICPLQDVCVARREGRIAELPAPKPGKALPRREAQMLMRPGLEKNGIALVLAEIVKADINIDPQQIKQVLLNLIQNAADSIGRDGTVTLRARRDEKRLNDRQTEVVILEVSDTGKGIPPEVEKRLFDPFFTTKDTGTGLGLSIAARIVEKHRGALQYQKQADSGVTFGIILPLHAP